MHVPQEEEEEEEETSLWSCWILWTLDSLSSSSSALPKWLKVDLEFTMKTPDEGASQKFIRARETNHYDPRVPLGTCVADKSAQIGILRPRLSDIWRACKFCHFAYFPFFVYLDKQKYSTLYQCHKFPIHIAFMCSLSFFMDYMFPFSLSLLATNWAQKGKNGNQR